MALYNPYRNYDKGMDDAYMGREPQNTDSGSYMVGYDYAKWLLSGEEPNNPYPSDQHTSQAEPGQTSDVDNS